jgi:hypothetical protein
LLCVFAVCCGGESRSEQATSGDDAAGAGQAANPASGGAPADLPGQAGTPCCVLTLAGAGGEGGTCDAAALWRAIGTAGGYLICLPASPDLEPTEKRGPGRGAVVLDDDGRVTDNTGLDDAAKQAWLEQLAGQRWPCLASRTLGYSCSSHD